MLYTLARNALFRLDPEVAHDVALRSIAALGAGASLLGAGSSRGESRRVMGLDFPNPVGLAAGLDKNGEYIDALAALGFGFVEVGTVTPRPQPGNARPRLFRLEDDEALVNRMGFNNLGVERLLRNVERARFRGILGINIGKNFDTPLERAAEDYVLGLHAVYAHASYVTINVSSPNTQGLRDLQAEDALASLLARVTAERDALAQRHGRRVPLAVKIAPDLTDEAVRAIAKRLVAHRIDAVIATNTTTARDGVEGLRHANEAGGLSGAPLRPRALATLRTLVAALDGALPVIAVGGIMSGQDARERIAAGASLVQLYTGLIYRGPALVEECVRALAKP